MFECPRCKAKTNRLRIADGPLGCPECIESGNWRNANLHQNVNPFVKMTYADKQRIVTRTKGSDGQYRAAKQWRDTDGY